MFEEFDYYDLTTIYQGLRALIEGESGHGFHNGDLGHPAYRVGATGKIDPETWGDGPEKNGLFQMLSEISKELKKQKIEDSGFIWWYDFSEWQQFCQFAIGIRDGKQEKQLVR